MSWVLVIGRKVKLVFIPRRVRNTGFHCPVDPQIRHQPFISCITATGDAYCPFLISADRSVMQVFKRDVSDGIDLKIELASSLYVAQGIFNRYLDEVVILAVISNQFSTACKARPAVQLSDDCSAHCSDEVPNKLARHGH
jgi:hypothetical protein